MSSTATTETLASKCQSPASETVVATPTTRVPVVRYDLFFSQRTLSWEHRKTARNAERNNKIYRKKPLLVVTRHINKQGQHEGTTVEIKSAALRDILRDIHRGLDDTEVSESRPSVNFEYLFHSRHGLSKRLREEKEKNEPDKNLVFELESLINLIEEDYGGTISDYGRLTAEGRINFDLLWALFYPGALVYRRHPLLDQAQIMRFVSGGYFTDDGGRKFGVEVEYISNSGRDIGLVQASEPIKKFSGAIKIQDLALFPLEFHCNEKAIREHAIARGKRFLNTRQQLFTTTGFAIQEKVTDRDSSMIRFNTYGRVMIDPTAFLTFQPSNIINQWIEESIEVDSLTDDDYLICTPVALGFCFGTKTWGGFALENLTEVAWDDAAFDQLVLKEPKKNVVHSLIKQHAHRSQTFDDVITGKGRGLVGLLCGNPGCGKTLTAEAVAEVTHMPLYTVGAGELGTSARDVDRALTRIFDLAHRWNVVVLLDEADVFLHKRSLHALEQNALVSIFLRHLEYYQGILIMTTNMSDNFDPAFESRIHFCMRYPDLDFDSRKTIWKTFVGKAVKQMKGPDFTAEEYDLLSEQVLNGRQIKNAVSVGVSLAVEGNVPLSAKHIDLVLETKAHWENAKLEQDESCKEREEGQETLPSAESVPVSLPPNAMKANLDPYKLIALSLAFLCLSLIVYIVKH